MIQLVTGYLPSVILGDMGNQNIRIEVTDQWCILEIMYFTKVTS